MRMKKVKQLAGLTVLNLFFILLCIIVLVPITYAFFLSISERNTVFQNSLIGIENVTLKNYKAILFEEPFLMWFKNSFVLSVGTMIIAMGTSVTAAYSFSRFRFRGREKIIKLLLILNAFPQILSMFAIFHLFKNMNLLNSYIGLILIYAGSMCIFGIWNMKGYFDTIPVEIEESAGIDGASSRQIIHKIILPLARPAIIVTAVMVLIFVWNEYLFATTFLMKEDSYTLAGGLYQLQSNDYSRNWPLFSAASILTSAPILILFFCIQKYMVSGLTAGGVKG